MPGNLFSIKVSSVCFLFFISLLASCGAFIYHSTAESVKRQMGNHCLGIATAVATLIEQHPDTYRAFVQTLDPEEEYYQSAKKALEKIRYSNDDTIRFLYTEIRKSDTEMMYVLDGEKTDAELFSPPGSTDLLTPTRKRAYETQAAYIGEVFTDNAYGQLLSAYAPIRDGDGTFLGLVGVDVSAKQYDTVMMYQMYIIALSIASLSLMMLVLGHVIFRLYKAKMRSDQANVSKSAFLARMSHEIRTPMNAIVGMSELMLRENLPPAARKQVVSVRQASANLLAIINDILDFSKIESDRMTIAEEPYQFSSLINDVISIIRIRLIDKPVLFTTNIASHIPNNMIGDEVRLRQILLNILSNAAKYTDKGHVSLAIDSSITERTAILTIEVSDTGIGVREKDLGNLFDEFSQVNLQKNRQMEGTGLGLAITKRLCRAMGGDITVSSRYGEGSTFTVTLPQRIEDYVPFADVECPGSKAVLLYETRVAYADSIFRTLNDLGVTCTIVTSHAAFLRELQNDACSHVFVSSFLYDSVKRIMLDLNHDAMVVLLEEYGESGSHFGAISLAMPAHAMTVANILSGVEGNQEYNERDNANVRFIAPNARVLVVDDIKTNLLVAQGVLAPFRMQVDCATSGKEAVDLVRTHRYDLVLMDHMMPEMDGIEATEKIRALGDKCEYYEGLPIIALTANAVSGMRNMFLENGMDDFIAKPIETVKFYAMLEKWIPKGKQEKYVEGNALPSSGSAIEINGIDTKAGLSMTGGNLDNYLRILDVFHRDCFEKSRQIHDSLKAGKITIFTTCVHALKSASASIGAFTLAEHAGKLELAGTQGDMDFITENIGVFLRTLAAMAEHISERLNRIRDDGGSEAPVDGKTLAAQLVALKEALAAIDVEATDRALAGLREGKRNGNVQEKLERVYQAILLFEYEEANRIIDDLLSDT